MGTGTSLPITTYHHDRGGVYIVEESFDTRTYKWYTDNITVEVVVFVEEYGVRAHLVEYKTEKIHFTNENNGHVDIIVKDSHIQIKDVYLKHKGMCSDATTKTMFCAIRTYVARVGKTIPYGSVTITSKNAKAAFKCYKSAFKNNGYETDSEVPATEIIKQWTIQYIKSITRPLKLE
tara:strand:+ start:9387 stop:9917 length:531 start_codon:yes stop_codon:yes gene_type:complete